MKKYYQVVTMLFLVFGVLSLASCGGLKPDSNEEVKNFLNKFNNQEFLTKLEKQRSYHYEMVRNLNSKGYGNDDLKLKYVDSQTAFNNILNKMIADYNGVSSIVGFKLLDPESKYNEAFENAREIGDKFLIAGNTTLTDGVMTAPPRIGAFIVNSLWPLIKKVHNKYLDYCKMKMENELNRLKFESWGNI